MISRILHQYAYSKRMVGVWAPRGGLSLAHRALCTSSSSGTPVRIPQDAVSISFARSSGAGGQNVNKVNTKAELRFNLQDARGTWLPSDVADRLATMYDKHTTKAGEFFVSSEQHRTQGSNVKEAWRKLERMVACASIPPKERNLRQDLSEQTKAARRNNKRHRSSVKSGRARGKGLMKNL